MTDSLIREKALSVSESFIVHAPAGSGKTELLVKRYLALLKTVKDPEEIIAITFTKKAAFEMKERILKALGGTILPARLRILTIDALCAKLARCLPMESGLGSVPLVSKDPVVLYQKAARRLLQDEPWSDSLWVIARHMQNQLALLEELLAKMLSCREQWLETLMSAKAYQHHLRAFLEDSVSTLRQEVLDEFLEKSDPALLSEMESLLDFVLSQQGQSFGSGWTVERLQFFSNLCLTQAGMLRKTVDKRSGFPADFPVMKARMKHFLEDREPHKAWVGVLQKAQDLPESYYSEKDWEVIKALIEVLPLLVSHLNVLFLEKGEVDFNEIALRSLHALGDAESPTDLALILDYQIRHILVDEFQDTSPIQFRLIEALVRGWEPEDGRTLFLVGDPMQSIYRFRQADVRLFSMALKQGVGEVPLTPIYLSSNFRSAPQIVNFCNEVFSRKAQAIKGFRGEVHGYGWVEGTEARKIVEEILKIRAQYPSDSIAVLGRSRSQVADILSLLMSEGIPVEALDMQNLAEALIIRDLSSLLYAFSNETDQLSWCSFLRSPWVGLSLEGVLIFSQRFHEENHSCPVVLESLKEHPEFKNSRVSKFLEVYASILPKKVDQPIALWLFDAFEKLGGGRGVREPQEAFAAEQFFRLLEEFPPWETPDRERLKYALSQRFVRAESAENSVQVMTIHKSKGLEFDHVFVPRLHRMSARDDLSLLLFQERLTAKGWQLLLSPIKSPKGENSSLYRYLYQEEQNLGSEENRRVLYVASTRAKKTLHFSFSIKESKKTESPVDFKPIKGSFLEQLFPFISWNMTEEEGGSRWQDQHSLSLHRIRPEEPPVSLSLNPEASGQAEDLNHPDWPDFSTFKDRAVGTVVHRYFSRWVKQRKLPETPEIQTYQSAIAASLLQLGVEEESLGSAVQEVNEALLKTRSSEKAFFLFLAPHQESYAEYRVTWRQGHLVNVYVIDRTFVDQNTRFIIDYKVAHPLEGEAFSDFFTRLKITYEPQLNRYAQVLRNKGERRPIKLGLFLPLQDEWVWI